MPVSAVPAEWAAQLSRLLQRQVSAAAKVLPFISTNLTAIEKSAPITPWQAIVVRCKQPERGLCSRWEMTALLSFEALFYGTATSQHPAVPGGARRRFKDRDLRKTAVIKV